MGMPQHRNMAHVDHPGTILREELAARKWTLDDFAAITGKSKWEWSRILNGKRGITPRTAHTLAAALGTSAEFWMRLWNDYRLWLIRDA